MSLTTAQTSTGHVLPAFITPDGVTRLLAATTSGGRKMAAPPFAAENPVIPRSEWVPLKRPRGKVPILNQGQHGSCTGHGGARSLMKSRERAGCSFVLLSPTFLYAQVNRGIDAGADPADIADTLLSVGTCTMQECGEDAVFKQQIAQPCYATARRFLALEIYQCHTFDEAVSAWLLGCDVFDTVNVGAPFNQLDADGVAPVTAGYGNHCISSGDELKRDSRGNWLLEHANSWGDWGQGGFFFMSEAHYAAQPDWEAFAIRSVAVDPQDPANPPA